MYIAAFRLAITYHVQLFRHSSGDVALLWDGDRVDTIQTSPKVLSGGTSIALPILQLLRNRGERFGRKENMFITVTAPPTEACLGMARMCGIKDIMYLSGGMIYVVACNRNGTTPTSFTLHYDGPFTNVAFRQGRFLVNAPWNNAPSNYKANFGNWLNILEKNPATMEGKAAAAAKTLPLGGAPQTSKFRSSGLEYLGLKAMVNDQTVVDNVMMMIAFEMVSQVSGFKTAANNGTVSSVSGQRSTSYEGQNIGSLLTDGDGNILSWGFNTNKENSTRHGEVNLIASYLDSNPDDAIPASGAIYTTLEPCEMCSGLISRAVPKGGVFRVIYGQKDDNVASTALQRKANASITMEASKAVLATPELLRRGTAVGATTELTGSMKEAQRLKVEGTKDVRGDKSFIATTKFLKDTQTYSWYFDAGRPNWWLYLWDYMTSKLTTRSGLTFSKSLEDPEVVKLNNQLDIIFQLVEQFMKQVKTQALVT